MSQSFEDAAHLSVAACGVMCQWTDRLRNEIRCSGCWWMCLARFGSPATACVDQAEDLSPQSSPFRDAWIGKNVHNKRVSDRVLFPSPAPEHPAEPLKCLAFRGFCFFGAGKVSKKCRKTSPAVIVREPKQAPAMGSLFVFDI